MDTIFALASARGKAGVAVIRLSGPASWMAGQQLAGDLPPPRVASLRHLTDASGGYLDQALVLCFEKGHSFTGEDVLEFQLHGSVATVSAVLDTLARLPDLRLAEPGEFTRRALENGCLDLAQVEGLSDLIEAETEAQRKQALRVFQGDLGKLAETWRRDLVRALSLLEATIDFADEEIPPNLMAEVQVLLAETRASLQAETDRTRIAERIRDGFEVAIIGPPNIGKSSLLNRLAGRQAAITSEVAGTTRDVIEVHMDLGGLPVTILDTAGIRETSDTVESLGVARAHSRAELADIRVFLVEPGAVGVSGVTKVPGDIVVVGKSDLHKNNNALAISSVTGEGISALVDLVTSTLQDRASGAGTATRLRHRLAMGSAISLLGSAQTALQTTPDATELVSSDIYLAIRALDSLIGRVDVEHILDEIFASFCLGK